MSLTKKQQAFIQEYLIDFNGTQAAIRAGYSEKTANPQAARLLAKASVSEAIERAIDARNHRTQVTADRVVKELARVAFADMRNYVEWSKYGMWLKDSKTLSPDDTAAVTEVSEFNTPKGRTVSFKLGHKDSALKLLAQHTGVLGGEGDTAQEAQRYLELLDMARADAQDLSE